VFISAGVQAINDFQKDKQFRELNETALASKKVTAIRDGQDFEVQLSQVVVGDIVTIVAGDEIAGDALLINGSSVLADEASMTGESDVLHKEP
jgi:P-type E1-E2 ATPase